MQRCKRLGFNPCVRKILWSRKWQPTLVFLPGESHGQRSLVGYSPWGCKESDTTEHAQPYGKRFPVECHKAFNTVYSLRNQSWKKTTYVQHLWNAPMDSECEGWIQNQVKQKVKTLAVWHIGLNPKWWNVICIASSLAFEFRPKIAQVNSSL